MSVSPRAEHCPECGAPRSGGLGCWERLGAIIAWEADDPALQREHFLTVASYNLQHPAQYTDAAIAGLREVYVEHLDRGIPIAEIRRRVSAATEGSTRVRRDERDRRPVQRDWPMTIADVYLDGDPRGAADRVRRWAHAIRGLL